MSGTTTGGKKAAEKNRQKHGKDFYAKIGAKGGRNSKTGGFWYSKYVLKNNFASICGRIGGTISRKNVYIKVNNGSK